jgi:hypothetical protein
MIHEIASNLTLSNQSVARPPISSYAGEYEHSLEHYVDVRCLVQNADKEGSDAVATFAAAS